MTKKELREIIKEEIYNILNEQTQVVRDLKKRARAERKGGGSIEINYRLPYVAVELSDGSEYFFQGQEASELLDEVPENINEEDFILVLLSIAQNW